MGPNRFPARLVAWKPLRYYYMLNSLSCWHLPYNHLVIRSPPKAIVARLLSSARASSTAPKSTISMTPDRPDASGHTGGQTKAASLHGWDEATYGASGSSRNTTATSLSASQRRVFGFRTSGPVRERTQLTDPPALETRSAFPDAQRYVPSQRTVT
jgi:hypothetical protein